MDQLACPSNRGGRDAFTDTRPVHFPNFHGDRRRALFGVVEPLIRKYADLCEVLIQ